ncbi:hypothetical protein A3A46_01835 [Candidatus Roizmanbacteria bacterium RIFCSPLOWO2_01_FULL_37_13]|uniref:Nucleotidyl transferase AbiEii/AbiGii toxin family protein n=1 Tax=Candidatus Roizmanbacteria bacterium RIFCSPHIGHO2_02_FULL_38_11 TaxID=1802039 RepID=A0A1F7H2C7_9BACT|nr:MAG: hypothetical protein A3C25_03085 [Candidatus Roizmanbacteria bacterium RIFCSPHIGHO2_02_FULL_38_11]OGK42654.1 MAG: hypothetical protein A3A46_01835 [Candidatus Roizmanbacteria bacterium RIFCSPLOWO2_01_FULL_37_13]
MSLIHLELLDEKSRSALKKLSVFKKEGILAGGTALMLQIAHRYSFDFDVFFQRPLEDADYRKLQSLFDVEQTRVKNQDLFILMTKDGIEINFVHYYFPSLFKAIPAKHLNIYDIRDIAADKAITLGRRATWRDYFDIFYFLYKKIFTLNQIIELAERKFKVEFNPVLLLEQLVYYDDIQDQKLSFYKEKFTSEFIKKFLFETVKRYRQKIIVK